jgi:hypothetical protein
MLPAQRTRLPIGSIASASSSSTVALRWLRRICRSGAAMSGADKSRRRHLVQQRLEQDGDWCDRPG